MTILEPAPGRTFVDRAQRDTTQTKGRAVTKPLKRATDDQKKTRDVLEREYRATLAGMTPDQRERERERVAAELQVRREIIARFALGPSDGIIASRRARERAEQLAWDAIQADCPEISARLRAFDEAERAANEHLDLVEGLNARAAQDELDQSLAGWIVGGRNLLDRKEG